MVICFPTRVTSALSRATQELKPAQVSTLGLARIGVDTLQERGTGPASQPHSWADEFAQVSM